MNMMERLLHTPEGVRDIYNVECEKKVVLQRELLHRIHLYGFKEIQTPTFEYFDIFNKERGTVPSKDMYKFFDREGNTLVLRPDITPSIARCVAKYYKEETLPIRLGYCGNTYINNSSYQGKLKEVTQLGAELINDDSVEADAEMIALTVDCLKMAGLTEFQVEIGQADFFKGLVEEALLEEEEIEQLRELIEHKNIFGVEELISEKNINESLKQVFLKLPELFGTLDKLMDIKKCLQNKRSISALNRLEQLYTLLTMYGFEQYITFDLGMLSKYNYYTGIIFRAFTYGTGEAVANGGRYDSLVGQFGKEAPAIGTAVVIDQLMLALNRQKLLKNPEAENTLIIYKNKQHQIAIALANQFRSQNMNVELFAEKVPIAMEEYIAYAKRNGLGGILYLTDENKVQIVHAKDGQIQTVDLVSMLKPSENSQLPII